MLRTSAPLIGALGVNSMSALDFIETHPGAYVGAFMLVLALNAVVFYVGGRRAEQRFASQSGQEIRFRERGASGHVNGDVKAPDFGVVRKTPPRPPAACLV